MTYALPLLLSLLSLLMGYDEAELVFAGDAMQHQGQIDAARRLDGSYDYSGCFDGVEHFVTSADYAVVNLETPLGASGFSGYPCFNAPEAWADALAKAGFDLFLTANNHTLDRRSKGLRHTVDALDRRGLEHIGTYTDDKARAASVPLLRPVNNIWVGFLNYTYGTNGFSPDNGVVVDYIDTAQIRRDYAAARNMGAEIVTVCIHWGDEYHLLPNAAQRRMADWLCNLGVDMVIGAHPHVIQPMEMRTDSLTGRNQLVVYSLGNFISNMKTRDTRGGVMVRVKLMRGPDGVARVDSAEYLPVFTIPAEGGKNFRVMPAHEVSDPAWTARRDEFLREALKIFDTHNRGVGRVADR